MSFKRRIGAAALPDTLGGNGAKRRRVSDSSETPESTTETGLRFLQQLRNSRDKAGREVGLDFITLPDSRLYPDYYEKIKLPISIETAEAKLRRGEYRNLTGLESDLKRMVNNAKSYNEKNSSVFADAERIRKALSNFMVKHNPAYNDPNYIATATPIPDDEPQYGNTLGSSSITPMQATSRRHAAFHSPATIHNGGKKGSAPPNGAGPGKGDFAHDTYQNAQERIIGELLVLEDEDGNDVHTPFVNLPSRSLLEYYRTIKRPMSLKGIEKQINGQKGREEPTGVSLFKTWREFEDEVSLIWRNAREFNEDGSEICEWAGELEKHFYKRVAQAKEQVSEPGSTRIKLKMPHEQDKERLRIRFGQRAAQQGSSSTVAVDGESLKRQQDLVNAGANGRGASNPALPAMAQIGQDRTRSASLASPSLSASAVKSEIATPNEVAGSPATFGMPPPSNITPRLPSGSPHPSGSLIQSHSMHTPLHPPASGIDSRWRQAGKDASSALISSTIISTHPDLEIERPYQYEILPSDKFCHQSISLNFPPSHCYLRIIPTVASNAENRQTKLVVSVNGMAQKPRNEGADSKHLIFDIRILPGLNKIDIEMIAGPLRGAPKLGNPSQELELERVSIFANLMKT